MFLPFPLEDIEWILGASILPANTVKSLNIRTENCTKLPTRQVVIMLCLIGPNGVRTDCVTSKCVYMNHIFATETSNQPISRKEFGQLCMYCLHLLFHPCACLL